MLTIYRSMLPTFDECCVPEGDDEMILTPRVDVKRTNSHFELSADFPGMAEDEVRVDFKDGVLTIRGEKKKEREEENEGFVFSERCFGTFERSFRVPAHVSVDEIQASMKNGVLTVTIPVAEEQTKRIEVKAA